VGLLGVMCRRNVLMILLSVEIMLNAANLVLVAFSRLHANLDGQVFVFFTMTVAAAEVAVGLAIVIALYRLRRTTDVAETTELREVDYGPVPVLKLEGVDAPHDPHEPGVHRADEAGGNGQEPRGGAHGHGAGDHEPAGAGHGDGHGHGGHA
jgi:NADH-quinone oxidoreductase subunit K